MSVIADLHIHSRFSRACSTQITVPNLEKYAKMKGVNLLGTGDFTHPLWNKELKESLRNSDGIYFTKTGFPFALTSEISLMYTQGRGRSVHLVMLAPNFDVVDAINAYLDKRGRRDYDGRPIFKISCEQFTGDMHDINDEIEIIPSHAWTPYFGVFGSESGFDSLKEAFGRHLSNIHAIETGMSSSPEMNWRISELNGRSIVSFSDAHSFWPWRMGREATIFKKVESYKDLIDAIRRNAIEGTIETDPAYGKYHWDGHRGCDFSCSPAESRKLGGRCPVCGKGLTIGVEYRVEQITDQPTDNHAGKKPYHKMLPLHEVIAAVKSWPVASKKTWELYGRLIESFGNEFKVLIDAAGEDLERALPDEKLLVRMILQNREGRINVKPGYDGVYGVAIIDGKEIAPEGDGKPECEAKKQKTRVMQKGLSDFPRK